MVGKLATYQSLEDRLAKLITDVAALEAKESLEEEEQGKLHTKKRQIEGLKETIGLAGVLVFKQIDTDNSGKIDRAELMTMLKTLPKPPDATKTVLRLLTSGHLRELHTYVLRIDGAPRPRAPAAARRARASA